MAFCEEIRNFTTRRRNLLYLIQRYLVDNGFYSTAETLKGESRFSDELELCDNVDLDAMYLEYANYYHLKFGKYPRILKKSKPIAKLEVTTNVSKSGGSVTEPLKRKVARPHENSDNQLESLRITVKKLDTGQVASDSGGEARQCLLPLEVERSHTTLTDDALFGLQDWQLLVELVKTTVLCEQLQLHWSDVCGNRTAIDLIKEAVLTPILHPQYFTNGLKPWRSVLLHGPPGSGKTLLAKTLYAEMQPQGVTFFNITASILVSKWRGESEKLLRVLFHLAEKRAPSIIFLDEIEGMTSKRDRPTDHESSKRFKNELLQLLDGMEHQLDGVFILAATNLPWEIDEAFLRRFEKKLLVELPNCAERGELITKLLAKCGTKLSNILLDQLVKLSDNFTGDEIRLACKEIAMQRVRQAANVDNLHTKVVHSGESDKTFEQAFNQIKPISVKLLAKHQEWQQMYGS